VLAFDVRCYIVGYLYLTHTYTYTIIILYIIFFYSYNSLISSYSSFPSVLLFLLYHSPNLSSSSNHLPLFFCLYLLLFLSLPIILSHSIPIFCKRNRSSLHKRNPIFCSSLTHLPNLFCSYVSCWCIGFWFYVFRRLMSYVSCFKV
jgi:hypothetical protein